MIISNKETALLNAMSDLKSTKYVNRNGNKSTVKLWLIGVNECVITDIKLKQTKFNKSYIEVRLERKPCYVVGLKTKVSFVPYTDFIFNYDRAKGLCESCGHALKDKPTDMDFNTYFRHVYRRVDTFIGKQVKVTVWLSKEARKDDYGSVEQRVLYYDKTEDIYDWRMNVSYNINKPLDYWKVSRIFAV